MMKIQKLLEATVIIFAITIILQLMIGTPLDNQILYELLALSFVIALIQSFLFKNIIFTYSIPHQVLFLVLVWGMGICANFIFSWHYRINNLLLMLGIVMSSYVVIRLITYYQVKDEAKQMNNFLKKRKNE